MNLFDVYFQIRLSKCLQKDDLNCILLSRVCVGTFSRGKKSARPVIQYSFRGSLPYEVHFTVRFPVVEVKRAELGLGWAWLHGVRGIFTSKEGP